MDRRIGFAYPAICLDSPVVSLKSLIFANQIRNLNKYECSNSSFGRGR